CGGNTAASRWLRSRRPTCRSPATWRRAPRRRCSRSRRGRPALRPSRATRPIGSRRTMPVCVKQGAEVSGAALVLGAVRRRRRGAAARRRAARRVPAPLAADAARPRLVRADFLAETVQRERQAFGTRMSFGAAAAGVGAVAAPALARAAAVRGGRAAAARTAARGASRVGAAAASGAAVCAPGGPVAAACAVLAGAGAWLVTDWALLRLDERMHRENLERAFDDALRRFRAEVERELVASFDAAVAAHAAAVAG